MRAKIAIPVLLLLLSPLALPTYAHAVTASSVTLNFMCACGACNETLAACHCPQSDNFRSDIAQKVAQGWSEQQIIEDFVNRYGESVLVVNAGATPQAYDGNPVPTTRVGAVPTTRVGGSKSNTLAVFLIGFGAAAFIFAGVKFFSSSKASQQRSRTDRPRDNRRSSSKRRTSKGRSRSRRDDDEDLLDD